ncbi:MAG TPA: MFS transporter [Chloroflexia bacterium]|nr:MFS transporter [Chloroflexia bacterium]
MIRAQELWSTKLGAGFRALRHRNYRLFFFGQLVSLIGTWMQSVAQGWLVLQLAGKDADLILGLTSALQFAPVLLLSVLGGALADRVPKRKVLIVTQSVMMVLALVMALLNVTHVVQVWHVLVLAALLGVANAIDMPTRQAFVVELVGKEDLMNSIALNSTVFNAARIVGPAIAGLLIATVGVTGCFFLNGVSFVAVIAGLLMMRAPFFTRRPEPAKEADAESFLHSIGAGFRYIWATPAVLSMVLLVGAVGTFGLNFGVWLPVMARDVLHVGAEGYGLMMSVMGAGSLVAGLGLAFGGKRSRKRLAVVAAAAFAVVLGGLAFSTVYPVSLLLLVALGAAMVAFSATANTTVQLTVPDELRGRVMAVYMMVFAGTTPIGALLAGTLAHATSTPISMVAGALVSLLAVGATAWNMRRVRQTERPAVLVAGSKP